MHYQVVARSCVSSGTWSYYPCWAPGRDESTAERLALHASQHGYEAAIIHSVTLEMLEAIASRVVERQDTQLLPATRFLPRPDGSGTSELHVSGMEATLLTFGVTDAQTGEHARSALDKRRLELELGSGGDVTKAGSWRPGRPMLPHRMDVISAWLGMRARMLQGRVGGPADGLAASTAGDGH